MNSDLNDLFLLDTSAVVNIVRDNQTGRELLRRFNLLVRDEKAAYIVRYPRRNRCASQVVGLGKQKA